MSILSGSTNIQTCRYSSVQLLPSVLIPGLQSHTHTLYSFLALDQTHIINTFPTIPMTINVSSIWPDYFILKKRAKTISVWPPGGKFNIMWNTRTVLGHTHIIYYYYYYCYGTRCHKEKLCWIQSERLMNELPGWLVESVNGKQSIYYEDQSSF